MRHNGIKTIFRTLLAGIVLVAGTSAAQAASVDGTTAISVATTTTNPPGNIVGATSLIFTNMTKGGSSTGDFTSVPPGTTINAGTSTLVVATPATFTFGNATFGTFVASTVSFDQSVTTPLGSSFRNIVLTGTFAGGSLFPGENDATPATLNITLTQTAGGAIDSGFVLAVPVPEPASMAMLGLGLAGVLGATRLRRKAV